jgi:hypothetical protein
LGALTSWKPQGLSRPVMGLLYLYLLQFGIGYVVDVSCVKIVQIVRFYNLMVKVRYDQNVSHILNMI